EPRAGRAPRPARARRQARSERRPRSRLHGTHAKKVDMTKLVHPSEALFRGEKPFPVIPSCEHFAGSEKLILKALELQDQLGPVFDITCDCEDGAQAGKQREHARMVVPVPASPADKPRIAGARVPRPPHPAPKPA